MDIERFQAAGNLLFGERWQCQMAEALGVDDRTIRKWIVAGRAPDHVTANVFALMTEREAQIKAHLRKLRKKCGRG